MIISEGFESAVDGRVVRTVVCFQVKVQDFSTVGDVLVDVIQSIRLNTGGERSHLSFLTLVPDNTLNKTLTSANGEEVNGGGGGLELHGVVSLSMYLL